MSRRSSRRHEPLLADAEASGQELGVALAVVVDERGDRSAVGDLADAVLLAFTVGDGQRADLSQVVVVARAAEGDHGRAGVVRQLALDVPDATGCGLITTVSCGPSRSDRTTDTAVQPARYRPPATSHPTCSGFLMTAPRGTAIQVAWAPPVGACPITSSPMRRSFTPSPRARDDAGEVDALACGELEVDVVAELPLAQEPLDVVQARGHDLDDDLAGSGLGLLLGDELDDVEVAVPVVLHCTADLAWVLLRSRCASVLLGVPARNPKTWGTAAVDVTRRRTGGPRRRRHGPPVRRHARPPRVGTGLSAYRRPR